MRDLDGTRAAVWGRRAALALTGTRLALTPVMLALAIERRGSAVAAAVLVAAFLSDVFDGVVARRYGVSTAGLRRFDSITDSWFYLAAAVAAWRLHGDALRPHAMGIGLVLAAMAVNQVAETLRFGKAASYHSWSAKLWGLSVFSALLLLFATGSGALVSVAVACGLASHAENFLMTLALPEWRHDVPSLVHAWRIRRGTARR